MKYKKKTLKNGLRIVAVPMTNNETVTVLVLVEAGSKYEKKDNNGVSHFLEHMCFKGTEKRPETSQISYELDKIGSQYNAFTSTEYTGYYAKVHSKHFDSALDIVSDLYLNPIFKEEEIEKEKGVVIEEINMYEDMPRSIADELFSGLLYGDQPAGRTILGPKENIKNMTRDMLVKYRAKHYIPKNTTVVVSGDVKAFDVFKKIEAMFGEMPEGKKYEKVKVKEPQKYPKITFRTKKTDQTHMILGVRAFDIFDEDIWALNVLTTVLGKGMSSRLWRKLREELGCCYYVGASSSLSTDHGYMEVFAGVASDRLKEVVEVVLEELTKIKTESVQSDELKKAKDFLIGNMFLNLESSDSFAYKYGLQETLHKEILEPQKIASKIRKITAEDIMRVAKRIIKNKGLNMVLVGPAVKNKKSITEIFSV